MRIAQPSTVEALENERKHYGSLDELRARYAFQVSKGTLSRTLNSGSVSAWAESHIRAQIGLPPIPTIEVPACPDCGSAHTGRCHGKPVAAVVVLSEGERVTKAGKARKRKKYHRPCMDDAEYAEYLAWRDAAREERG